MNKNIIILLLILILIPTTVFGADLIFRLTHNDQDFLVIAEIEDEKDDSIVFRVIDNIVSKDNLNENRKIKNLDVDRIELNREDLNNYDFRKYKGDKYLLSVDETDGKFKIAWGLYEIDSLDKTSLNIINSLSEEEAIFLKHFVNSDGQENNFSVDGDKLMSGDEVISEGQKVKLPEEKEDIKKDEDKTSNKGLIKRRLPFLIIILGLVLVSGIFKKR